MPPPNPDLRSKIYDLSDGVRTSQQIADVLGISRSYVQELVREIGLPRRKRGSGKPRERDQKALDVIDRIKSLADGHKSSKEISESVQSSAKYVQRILLEFDLPRLPQSPPKGERNSSFSGGRHIDLDGYVYVSAPEGHPFVKVYPKKNLGRIYEHRLVLERVLGRFLQPQEVVDHVDGLTIHNHPNNLRVFASNADHLRATISDQVPCWSKEGLARMRLPMNLREDLLMVDSYKHERERGDVRLRQILRAWLLLGQDSPYLLGSHRWLERAGIFDLSRSSLECHLLRLSPRYTRDQTA